MGHLYIVSMIACNISRQHNLHLSTCISCGAYVHLHCNTYKYTVTVNTDIQVRTFAAFIVLTHTVFSTIDTMFHAAVLIKDHAGCSR